MTDVGLFLIATVLVAAVAFGLAAWLRVPIGAALLPAASAILLVHYAAVLGGVLPWASWISCGFAVAAVAAVLWAWRRRNAPLPAVDPGAVLAILCAAVCWWGLVGQRYGSWDEFSHWGLISKAIHGLDRLPRPGEHVELLDYPPGTALFHYFALQASAFGEGRSYAAQAWLVICAWSAILHRLSWRQAGVAIVGYVTMGMLAGVFGAGLVSLYVDLVVGSIFGAGVALAMIPPASWWRQVVLLAPVVAVLPTVKEIGWALALLIAAVAAAGHLAAALATPGSDRWLRRLSLATGIAVALGICLALSAFAARAAWRQHLVRADIRATFPIQAGRSVLDLVCAFAGNAMPRERVTVTRFSETLQTRPLLEARPPLVESLWAYVRSRPSTAPARPGPTAKVWIYVLVATGVLAALLQPDRAAAARVAVATVGLSVGCVAYLFAHLFAYLYAFSESEGPVLASFGRYIGIYMLGWTLALLAATVHAVAAAPDWARRVGARALLIAIAGGAATFAPVDAAHVIPGLRPPSPDRAVLDPALQKIRPHASARERIYTVFQGSIGYDHRIAKLELAPAVTNPWCWSLGAKYAHHQEDHWTCVYTPERVAESWREYTLLFLGTADKQFWDTYGALFPPDSQRHRVFRIGTRDGRLTLTPIDPPSHP